MVYAALDREFSAPLLDDFEAETGIVVREKFDVESTKTVGLASAILQERARPRCDVFWNNEVLHSLRLERAGVLEAYEWPAAKDFPADCRPAHGQWCGFAARVRVLLVNTERLPDPAARPTSIRDLADPAWQGQAGLALPLFGTTATHAAVLFAAWGDEEAQAYFRAVQDHAVVLGGNKQVATEVAAGRLAFGLTDTDDAAVELDRGAPVAIVYPDQGPDGLGALRIPNTLCLIQGGPNPAAARRLVDFLLRPEVEQRLAEGASAQFPVNPAVTARPRVAPEQPVRWMEADFAAAADKWDSAQAWLRDTFARAE